MDPNRGASRPHEFAQVHGARAQARHRLLPCMGCQNSTHQHQEIERGGMHRPWMAASHRVSNATIKRTMASAARGGLGRRRGWAERVGDGVYSSVGRRFEAPIKKMRGGALFLGGRQSTEKYNNQPKFAFDVRRGDGEETRIGGTRGGWHLIVGWSLD